MKKFISIPTRSSLLRSTRKKKVRSQSALKKTIPFNIEKICRNSDARDNFLFNPVVKYRNNLPLIIITITFVIVMLDFQL